MPHPLPDTRRRLLLDLLEREGEAHIETLSAALDVSPITVRRDVAALSAEGLLQRVRGGARHLGIPRPAGSTDGAGSSTGAAPSPPGHLSTSPSAAGGRSAGPGSGGSRAGGPLAGDRLSAGLPAIGPAGEPPRLAMVVPSLQYYWRGIIDGAADAAQHLGADLAIHASTANAEANLLVLEQIFAETAPERIDALIIGPELREGAASAALVDYLAEQPVPVVFVERGIDDHSAVHRSFDTVRSDHSAGAALAIRHLAALGHRRIAYSGLASTPTNHYLELGYARTLEHLGLTEECAPARRLSLSRERTFEVIDEALERYREAGTTGVLLHSDTTATLVLQHALRRGWQVPEDISFIAYDDELALSARPALTAVAPPKHALGTRAVELALHRLASPGAPIEHVELMPSLRERDTTAPPR